MARAGLEDLLPLSPLQEGLLFHALYDGVGGEGSQDVYAVQLVLALEGPLDPAALRAAGEALLRRHANLRAGFRFAPSGQPAQVVPRTVALPWREVELSGSRAADQPDGLAELVAAERAHGFDLARPPALRLVLVRLGEDEHRLLLTSHHILLDGWSTPVLVRELFALYAAGGDESALPAVPPYRDYLAWLGQRDDEAAHAAWDRALEGLTQPTRLVPGVSRRPGPAAEHVTELSPELTAGLADVARAHGLTLNTVLQGAWAVVLAAATDRDDVVFGTTVAVRPAEIPDVDRMIGLLVNTVPVRVRLRPAEALHDMLRRLQVEQAALLEHQYVGLAEIQRRVGLGELFDTLVVFENHPREPVDERVGGLRVTSVEAHDATHYPATLVATPGERLRLALHHRTDALGHAEAARLSERLERVLATVADEPTRPAGRCRVTAPDEIARVLDWGAGAVDDAARSVSPASLPELFAVQAAATPDAPAVRAGEEELTYAELDRRANRLAHHLVSRGVGPECLVALALPRSVEYTVAFLAAQKAGGACLPLDLDHPVDRLASVLADAAPQLVLATAASVTRLPAAVAAESLLLLDELDAIDRAGDGGADSVDPGAQPPAAGALGPGESLTRTAYVVYTSGSTGRPKGVVVSHTGIASLVATSRDRLGVGPGARVGQFASPGFDIAVWELCMALLSGGCLVVVPSECRADGDALLEFVRDAELSVLAVPPSLLAVLPADSELPRDLTLLVGSEPVPAELVRRWSDRARVVVAYGVTEATVNQTLWPAPPGWDGRTVPIGRPDPGTRVCVLDSGLHPRPPGQVGELYVGGDGVARGYLGKPELTAERFLPDPHGPPGSTMYRTGDLAHWSPEGELEFLGRADDQVQVRGVRVEPGEVESALLRQGDVAAAAVVGRRDEPAGGPTRLVAYVAPAGGAGSLDAEGLRHRLAAELPEAMVPSAFVALSALPRTANGKLDRAALPAPPTVTAGDGTAPRTTAEERLARLVPEILGVERVGVGDDFFSLGGDSISSIMLVSRARREGLELTPRAVFEHPTVAGLARVARPLTADADDRRGDHETELGRVPATPIVAWLREHGGVIDGHHQSMVLRIPAGADEQRLSDALQAVVDHHAMLRARLVRSTDAWELHVPPAGTVHAGSCLTRLDAEGLDTDGLRALVEEQRVAAMARLDPDAGTMLRAVWLDAGRARAGWLLLVIHHLVVDGVSWRILVPDLAAAWQAVAAGQPVELEPVPTSFRRWAHGLVDAAHQPDREAEMARWGAILEPPDPPLSPVGLDRRRDTAASTRHLTRTLSPELTAPLLGDVPAAFHGGVNDVLLTALALAVADWREETGDDDGRHAVLVNLEGHGREEHLVEGADLSRTVGWFTSTFPVRLDPGDIDLADALAGGRSAGQAVKRVKEQLRALPDKGVGFGLLRYLNARTGAELASLRWPQIGFNYLGRFAAGAMEDPDADVVAPLHQTLSGAVDEEMPAAYVLEINVITRDHDAGPELSVTWSWPAAVLSDDAVRGLADQWFAALDALVTHTRAPASGGHTPSDLLVALGQEEIDELEEAFADGGGPQSTS